MGKDKKSGLGTLKEVGGTSRVHAEVLSILMVLLMIVLWEEIHIRHMSLDSDNHDMLSFYPKDMVIIYHSKSGYVVERRRHTVDEIHVSANRLHLWNSQTRRSVTSSYW